MLKNWGGLIIELEFLRFNWNTSQILHFQKRCIYIFEFQLNLYCYALTIEIEVMTICTTHLYWYLYFCSKLNSFIFCWKSYVCNNKWLAVNVGSLSWSKYTCILNTFTYFSYLVFTLVNLFNLITFYFS